MGSAWKPETVKSRRDKVRQLNNLRNAHALTREDLADLIGVSIQNLDRWFNGTTMPSKPSLEAIEEGIELLREVPVQPRVRVVHGEPQENEVLRLVAERRDREPKVTEEEADEPITEPVDLTDGLETPVGTPPPISGLRDPWVKPEYLMAFVLGGVVTQVILWISRHVEVTIR